MFVNVQIKELEGKLKDQERRLSIATIADSSSTMKATPRETDKHIGGSRDKFLNEVEQHVLRSSNIMNRQTVASLNKSKRNDSLGSTGGGEVRRHRLSRNSEVENAENNNENKSRKSDGPRPVQRGATRMVKPAPTQVAQRPVNLSRPSVAQGVKDRESKKRMWA